MRKRRFVLLDPDGTLILERNYLARAEDVELLPWTLRGLWLLNNLGLGLVVLTNQSGLKRG
jgi:D-glycero-D-manno-heptose 1,7-bisphosphate phosphatase